MSGSDGTSWKGRLFLLLFGLVSGLLFCGAILFFFPGLVLSPQGTSFESLEDLRRAMMQPVSVVDEQEGVPLAGVITPHPDDKIIYDMRPNLDVTFQRARVTTNSCGLRSPELTVAKPANTYRIALLGDSFAFGWGVNDNETFAHHLQENLNSISKGKLKFEVLNFGTPGYSTFQEVARFEESGLDFQPDAVLVFFIRNDFGFPFYVRDVLNPNGSLLNSTVFAHRLKSDRNEALESQRIELLGLDPNTALNRLADLSRQHGFKAYVTINPKKGWEVNKQALWIFKKRRELQFISLRESFMESFEYRKIPEKALTLSFDPHPSPLRHKLLGDILTPFFMEPLLAASFQSSAGNEDKSL